MSPPFFLPAARDHDPGIDAWLDRHAGELGAIAQRWFACMRERGSDVREVLHDGYPTACVGEAAFAYVAVFRAHVNVGFFHGAGLADPAGLLQGTGQRMRHVKLVPGRALDAAALEALIGAAYQDVRGRGQAV